MGVADQYTKDATVFDDDMSAISGQINTLLSSIVEIADAMQGVSSTVSEAADGVTDIAQKTLEVPELSREMKHLWTITVRILYG